MFTRRVLWAAGFVLAAAPWWTGGAGAAVVGGPDVIPAPASVEDDPPGAVNDHQQAFDERQCVVLPVDLPVDGGAIPAGTVVDSHLIFLNTDGPVAASDPDVVWTFDGPVLGVQSDVGGTLEAASSALLGAPGTAYPAAFPNRGLETNDGYAVAGPTVTLTSRVSEPGDWVRVITEAPAGCGSLKWRQPPDRGWGVNLPSQEPGPRVADDWQCLDPRPVTDVHFWGSYPGWEEGRPVPSVPPPGVERFVIRIYADLPAGPDRPFSRPGELLYTAAVEAYEERLESSEPRPDGTYEHKLAYRVDLPQPFPQEVGRIYWLSVTAVPRPLSPATWGWETSTRHWNDNAVRRPGPAAGWEEIRASDLPPWYGERYDTVDMAFALSVGPRVPPPPPPPEPVKWQQRPDTEGGVNVVSLPFGDGIEPGAAADDWLCLGGSPVADLHFWGSYPGWFAADARPQGPPPGVDAFRVRIYSDRPASGPTDFSRPARLLYEAWVRDFAETYVGSFATTVPAGAEFEHKFRYDLELPRIFWQERGRVYWLEIAAVPEDPQLPWGWESSRDHWNDQAVRGLYRSAEDGTWTPLAHPVSQRRLDLSFELTTCGGPVKWLQFPDMDRGTNVPAAVPGPVVADDWLCTDGRPVEEIQFWGSYLWPTPDGAVHWAEDEPTPPGPPPGVLGFQVSVHEDVPAGVDPELPWSHPGEPVAVLTVPAGQVRERYWGSVGHVSPSGRVWWEHKYHYVVRLPEPIAQERGRVYWLDLAAVPDLTEGPWVWGWETSKDRWNDNAVVGAGAQWLDLGRIGTDFEDLQMGERFDVGDRFTSSEVDLGVVPFVLPDGTVVGTGHVFVGAGSGAGGRGHGLVLRSASAGAVAGLPVEAVSFRFGNLGGSVNLAVNGELRVVESFGELDGDRVGGAAVSVLPGSGPERGRVRLSGEIRSVVLGGQELVVDDVAARAKVDMAFLLATAGEDEPCEGDLDRDGAVGPRDLRRFAGDYGRTDCADAGDCEGDLDYDGDQDATDLWRLLEDWGREDCPCAMPEAPSCDDGLPCTEDRWDEAAGECRHVPKRCDDGNPCTLDACDPQTGQCLARPVCQACCQPDGVCVEIPPEECLGVGGEPGGEGSRCRRLLCWQGLD
ncbi:MAG: hypothetical protein Kow0092_00330 [Deferrisomatales bacterium]